MVVFNTDMILLGLTLDELKALSCALEFSGYGGPSGLTAIEMKLKGEIDQLLEKMEG